MVLLHIHMRIKRISLLGLLIVLLIALVSCSKEIPEGEIKDFVLSFDYEECFENVKIADSTMVSSIYKDGTLEGSITGFTLVGSFAGSLSSSNWFIVISFLLKPQLKMLEDKFGLVVLVSIFIGIILLSILFVLVNFIFVTQIKYDNPEMNAFKCFVKSFVLMKGNVFRFFSFVIRSCGINLVLALFYFGMSLSMNSVKNNFSSILSFVFDFLYFINIYKAAGRLYFTFPIAYTSLIENNDSGEVLEA